MRETRTVLEADGQGLHNGWYWQYPPLDAVIFGGGGLAFLLIGSWAPDPRLTVSGVPLNIVVMTALALIATLGTIRFTTLKLLALLQVPLLLLGVTILWSPNPILAVDTLTTLVFSSCIAFVLLNTVVERYGARELGRVLLMFLAVYLLGAVAYKAIFGLFNRQVLFLMNGPIIFGRFMSIAFVLSLITLTGKVRVVAAAIFYLAIVWTESKGPILAATVTTVMVVFYLAGPRGRLRAIIGLVAFCAIVFTAANYFDLTSQDIGRLAVLLAFLTGDFEAASLTAVQAQTVSARTGIWAQTIDLIRLYPFGVGLGGWFDFSPTEMDVPYAHNLFLELWSEGGIILGSLACVPLLLFFCARKSIFWFIALTLFLSQMVSGNLADARQMYVFSLLACLAFKDEWVSSALIQKRTAGEARANLHRTAE